MEKIKNSDGFNADLSSDKIINEYHISSFFRLYLFSSFPLPLPNLCISAAGTALFNVVPPASCGNHQSGLMQGPGG